MSFQVNVPPSMVAKMNKNEEKVDEATEKKKKEDWRKIKELEEARKAGTAPAMKDEEGKDINPHIPQYIMQAPWYTGAVRPTLMHQREPDEMKPKYSSMSDWYQKGSTTGKVSTKFREGACENCGAVGHTKKTCLERPRTRGARYTGTVAPDDYHQPTLSLSYDGKRDRWNGYDPAEHKKIVEEFQKVEEIKRELKLKKLENSLLNEEQGESLIEDEEDEDDEKYAEDISMPGQKFETKQRITVRNLRIREDTAKYLYNLDVNSAFYDPKTRAMRANPFQGSGVDPKELPYAGDNFVRWSGEAYETIKKQMFAWEAYTKGTDVHVQADPTKLELLHKEYQKKKEAYKESAKDSIIDKYGGQEHLEVPPKEFLLGQNEEYTEYSRYGTLVKGEKKPVVQSRYEEDVLEKNHEAIWGSYWDVGQWGYGCCYSLVRGSYCIGEAGIKQKMLENQDEDVERTVAEMKDKLSGKKTDEQQSNTVSSIEPNSLLHQHLERLQAEEKQKEKERKRKKKSNKKRRRHDSSNDSSTDPSSGHDNDEDDDDDDEPKAKKSHVDKSDGDRKRKKNKKNKKTKKSKKNKKHINSNDESDDHKLKEAIEKEKKRRRELERMMELVEKDRPYNLTYEETNEKDVEAFQKLRLRREDPMVEYFNK